MQQREEGDTTSRHRATFGVLVVWGLGFLMAGKDDTGTLALNRWADGELAARRRALEQ